MEADGGGATVCEDDDTVGRFSRALNQLLRHRIEIDQRENILGVVAVVSLECSSETPWETDTFNIHDINGGPS